MDSFRCYTLDVSFRLDLFSLLTNERRRKKNKQYAIEEHKWNEKEKQCLVLWWKWGKKGYWEKRLRLFFVIYLASFSKHTRTFVFSHTWNSFSSVFQSVPLILTRRRCDRNHSHLKYDLPINFHRFKMLTKQKEHKKITKFLFTQNYSFEFWMNVNPKNNNNKNPSYQRHFAGFFFFKSFFVWHTYTMMWCCCCCFWSSIDSIGMETRWEMRNDFILSKNESEALQGQTWTWFTSLRHLLCSLLLFWKFVCGTTETSICELWELNCRSIFTLLYLKLNVTHKFIHLFILLTDHSLLTICCIGNMTYFLCHFLFM